MKIMNASRQQEFTKGYLYPNNIISLSENISRGLEKPKSNQGEQRSLRIRIEIKKLVVCTSV
jgi:hypothetical protein